MILRVLRLLRHGDLLGGGWLYRAVLKARVRDAMWRRFQWACTHPHTGLVVSDLEKPPKEKMCWRCHKRWPYPRTPQEREEHKREAERLEAAVHAAHLKGIPLYGFYYEEITDAGPIPVPLVVAESESWVFDFRRGWRQTS